MIISSFCFAEETLSGVHHYELVVPSLVEQNGDFISYDVTDSYHVRNRAKRSITTLPLAEEITHTPQWIFYRLEAFGRLFHLNLTLNKGLISPKYVVDYVGKDGLDSNERHRTLRECHYYGYLSEHEQSRVALSNCHGLVSKDI